MFRFLLLSSSLLLWNVSMWAGDTPCTATPVSNNMTTFQTFDTSGTSNSDIDAPLCGNYDGQDFWISFIGSEEGRIVIETVAGSLNDIAFNLYWGELCGGSFQNSGCFNGANCDEELMPKVSLDGLYPGETYYLRIWAEGGGTGTFDLLLSPDNYDENFVQLTHTGQPSTVATPIGAEGADCYDVGEGCVWSSTPLDFNQSFEQEFSLTFGLPELNLGGMALIFKPRLSVEDQNQNFPQINCKSGGLYTGGLGVSGVIRSWIVEFDINDDGPDFGDIPEDHIAIDINEDAYSTLSNPIYGPIAIPYDIEDGNLHRIRTSWNPVNQLFKVYFDDVLFLAVNHNIIDDVFDGENMAYWGITTNDVTGIHNSLDAQQQIFCFDEVNIAYNTSYTIEESRLLCKGDGMFVGGAYQTESDTYVDVYTAQNGCDSTVYTHLEIWDNEAIIDELISLPCDGASEAIVLDATASIVGENTNITWSSSDGNIIDGEDTLTPTVEGTGEYTLTILDLDSGCSDGTTVEVIETEAPVAEAGQTLILDCNTSDIHLDGIGSSVGSTFSYLWSSPDASILANESTLAPSIGGAGMYYLTVTNDISGCTAIDSVMVSPNEDIPMAYAASMGGNLNCAITEVQLSATGSSEGASISYEWTTNDGQFVSEVNDTNPIVNAAGTYTLIVSDLDSGCSAISSVQVESNTEIPIAIIQADTLSCIENEIVLETTGSSIGNEFTYEWQTMDGQITQNASSLTPSVSAAGTYELIITNTTNGCTTSENVLVSQDADIPIADVGLPQTLNCTQTSITLDASASSSGNTIEYTWSSESGHTINGISETTPIVENPGVYELLVTNIENGCTAIDHVEVLIDTLSPQAIVDVPPILGCNSASVNLAVSVSGDTVSGDTENINYTWTTDDGQIESGATSNTPVVSSIGTYDLMLENTINGCTATQQLVVMENIEEPVISTATPDLLTCTNTEIFLQGEATGQGFGLEYEWQDDNGNTLNSGSEMATTVQLTQLAQSPGLYTLLVTDIANGCTSATMVEVTENIVPPTVEAGGAQELDCTTTALSLNGTASPNTTLNWTSTNGNFVGDATSSNPQINAAGIYTLTATNIENGCTASDIVEITQDNDVPQVDVGMNGVINCNTSSYQLNATQSVVNENINFEWSTVNGQIESGETTLNPIVNQEGIYTLTLTNIENNCTAASSVEVTEDMMSPVYVLAEPAVLDCENRTSDITILGLDEGNYSYEWSSIDGTFLSNQNDISTTVEGTGVYDVLVTDLENGCTAIHSVEVFENVEYPDITIVEPGTLNCVVETVVLVSQTVEDPTNWTYTWSSEDGNILSGVDGENIQVNATGTYELLITNNSNQCTTVQLVEVVENLEIPNIELTASNQLDCLTDVVEIDASNTTNADMYEWILPNGISLSSNMPTLEATEVGVYQVLATNTSSQCTATNQVEVFQDIELPSAQIESASLLDCSVQNIQLNGLASSIGTEFSYQWTSTNPNFDSSQSNLEPSVSSAGEYTLLVTDESNNCTAMATITVEEDENLPQAQIALPELLTCDVSEVVLQASMDSSSENITLQWTTENGYILSGETTLTPEIAAPGIYTLSLLDTENNCENRIDVQVQEDVVPPNVLIAPTAELTCTVTSLNLDGSASSTGTDYIYSWTTTTGNIVDGANTLTPEINQVGLYELLITNISNGCTEMATTQVLADENVPLASIVSPEELNCLVSEVVLSAENLGTSTVEYAWTSADGNIVGNTDSPNVSVNQPGIYTLVITDPENGCSSTQNAEVSENRAYPEADAGQGIELTCSITEYTLQAMGSMGSSFDLVWQTQDGNFASSIDQFNPTVNQAGTYQLIITNTENGCTAEDIVLITQNENIPTGLSVEALPPDCHGDTGGIVFEDILGGEGPYMYSIDGGLNYHQDANFLNIAPDNTYALRIEDVNGCVLDTTLIVPDVPELVVVAEPEIELEIGDQHVINAHTNFPETSIASYEWSPTDGLSCTDCLTPVVNNFENTAYTLTITNLSGCTASATVQLRVDRDIKVYIPNVFSPNGDGANDAFTIFAKDNSVETVELLRIYDRWGNKVFENTDFPVNDLTYGWDGIHKAQAMNPAVFAYYAKVLLVTGESVFYKGDVTLVR